MLLSTMTGVSIGVRGRLLPPPLPRLLLPPLQVKGAVGEQKEDSDGVSRTDGVGAGSVADARRKRHGETGNTTTTATTTMTMNMMYYHERMGTAGGGPAAGRWAGMAANRVLLPVRKRSWATSE
jgi:hypothetical protein